MNGYLALLVSVACGVYAVGSGCGPSNAQMQQMLRQQQALIEQQQALLRQQQQQQQEPAASADEEPAAYQSTGCECISGDCKNGQGTCTWPAGEEYVGEFRNGKMNGQGTWTESPAGERYVGGFRDNKMSGQGTLTLPNGHKYELKDGQPTEGTW